VKTDTTAVTVGVTNNNKTDLVLTGTITTPTDETTDPAITTTYTKADLHTSTGGTTASVLFIGMYKQTSDTVQTYPLNNLRHTCTRGLYVCVSVTTPLGALFISTLSSRVFSLIFNLWISKTASFSVI